MKKILIVLAFVMGLFLISPMAVNAEETGNLTVHFRQWEATEAADYDALGCYGWTGVTPKGTHDGVDDFGAYFEFENITLGDETMGFIAVEWPGNVAETWDGSVKRTQDVDIPKSVLKAGETVHVYVFEGHNKGVANSKVLVGDPSKAQVFVIFYSPAGYKFEEGEMNIGFHTWGFDQTVSGWGSPYKGFNVVGQCGNEKVVGAVLTAAETKDAGCIVYDGSNKNTGNLEKANFGEMTAGELKVLYVNDIGVADNNSNVFDDYALFAEEAFTFRFKNYDSGDNSGTFAYTPLVISASVNQVVDNPMVAAKNDEEKAAARAKVEGWFTLREIISETEFGNAIPIKKIDFSEADETLSNFVINLDAANKLDNTKRYQLVFDLGLKDEDGEPTEENKRAEIEIIMDTEAPVITFIHEDLANKPADERIIEIKKGTKWKADLFPRISAEDDRDGDISVYVYVPAGERSKVHTGVKGDYVIEVRVVDTWGNECVETFIYRVK